MLVVSLTAIPLESYTNILLRDNLILAYICLEVTAEFIRKIIVCTDSCNVKISMYSALPKIPK